jgi:hypothetical protein
VIATTPASGAAEREEVIWASLGRMLVSADPVGVLANKLGPMAARVLDGEGRPVPRELEAEARLAKAAWMASVPLLGRIRSACEGPLVLIKGAEVAALYPGRARAFLDIDLLCPDPTAAHAALRDDGFVEVDDPALFIDQHHLRPLQCPGIWLQVEIHLWPLWPQSIPPPPVNQIVAGRVPSATGVPGISAPDPAHHALILAAHHWATQPLHALRDVVDIAAVAARTDPAAIEAAARAWGVDRLWRTTFAAANGLLGGERQSAAVAVWARHLPAVRERSVLSNHLGRWLSNFWGLPLGPALRGLAATLRKELLPYPGETWREKLIRVWHAVARPRASMSSHADSWRDAAGVPPDVGHPPERR